MTTINTDVFNIEGTGGIVVPKGDDGNRPVTAASADNIQAAYVGLLRWNTTNAELEIWNGAAWTGVGSSNGSYVLPPATTSTLGGVIVGDGLSVDSNGILSASGSATLAGLSDVEISSPANGQVLTYDSSLSKWQNAAGGSFQSPPWQTKTANYTAVSGDYLLADTTNGAFTITLPSNPILGNTVVLQDPTGYWSTNNLTVTSPDKDINFTPGSLIFNVSEGFTMFYTGESWVSSPGGTGIAGPEGPPGDPSVLTPIPTVLTFGSGTYTVPDGTVYLRVRMVGGGGGGAGSALHNEGEGGIGGVGGGTGGTTVFGNNLVVAEGGLGAGAGSSSAYYGYSAPGGSASVATSSDIIQILAVAGGGGGNGEAALNSDGNYQVGGTGGNSVFGGGGAGGPILNGNDGFSPLSSYPVSPAGAPNTGGGGGGAGTDFTNGFAGGGGGAGGYVEAIILNPSSTYTYTVGAGGTAGPAGLYENAPGGGSSTTVGNVGQSPGGEGGSGVIIVEAMTGTPLSSGGGGGSNYTLPVATDSTLGGVIVGSGLAVTGNGTLSVTNTSSAPYNMTVFTNSGTFTTPSTSGPNTIYRYRMVGGGGQGGGGYTGGSSSGGGAGAYAEGFFSGIDANTDIAITIGAGGVGGGFNSAATNGGNTSIGSPVNVTAGGGTAGNGSNTYVTGGPGGTILQGSPLIGIPGAKGDDGMLANGVFIGGNGAPSPFGGGGIAGITGDDGPDSAATGYGAGGAGLCNEIANGSAGAPGIVIIEEMYGQPNTGGSGGSPYTLPAATTSTLGGVIVSTGLSVDSNGNLTADVTENYTLPAATTSVLGGVIVGSGLSVDGSGTISVVAAGDTELSQLSDVDITSPTNGQVLTYNSTSSTWQNSAPSGSSSGTPVNWVTKNSDYTASNGDYLFADTSAGSFTITLPSSPVVGAVVGLQDPNGSWPTNNLTVISLDQNIEYTSGPLIFDVSDGTTLLFSGDSWVTSNGAAPPTTGAQTNSQLASAWVMFSGTTGTIANSYNVSSVTHNATGDYTVNFTTAMSSANYFVSVSAKLDSSGSQYDGAICGVRRVSDAQTSTSVRVFSATNAANLYDSEAVYVLVFGG